MENLKSYFFTVGPMATEKEKAQAEKLKYTLINGLYGNSFNKECKSVAGNYPEHLKSKAKKPVIKRQVKAK